MSDKEKDSKPEVPTTDRPIDMGPSTRPVEKSIPLSESHTRDYPPVVPSDKKTERKG
jgi:hypothetical protein